MKTSTLTRPESPRVLSARDQGRVDWFRKEARYWRRQAVVIAPTFLHVTDAARAEFVRNMLSYERECLAIVAEIEAQP